MDRTPPPLFRQGIPIRARYIFFLLISLVLILVDGRFHALDSFRNSVTLIIQPAYSLISYPREMFASLEQYAYSKASLKNKYEALLEENVILSLALSDKNQIQEENEELKLLLKSVKEIKGEIISAKVISLLPDPFSQKIRINVGAEQKLSIGMPVIGQAGLLGRVTRVLPYYAEVTLIVGREQQLLAKNTRTGKFFLLEGNGDGYLQVLFALPNSDVQKGDMFVSAGLDDFFPKNLKIGEINNISHNPKDLYVTASISPFATIENTPIVTVRLTRPLILEEQEEQPTRRRVLLK